MVQHADRSRNIKLYTDAENPVLAITPRASWKGGAYERLVGLIRLALRNAIGRHLIDSTQLQTYITEVEGILNVRLLTYLNEDSIKNLSKVARDIQEEYNQITWKLIGGSVFTLVLITVLRITSIN